MIKFSEAIQNNDVTVLGDLLYESHEGLIKRYLVSCKELDFLVRLSKDNPKILGSRMMDGGFGGCTINLVENNEFKKFKEDVMKKFKKEFNTDCSVFSVKLSQGTRIIK